MASGGHLTSIIVPMRNAERYAAGTLNTILSYRDSPIEVIVVDDNSTDASRAKVSQIADSRIRLIDGPGRGIAACLNTGLAAAHGDIVMRCDADDLYPPTRISRQLEWLHANHGFVAVCGAFSTIDENGAHVSDLQCGEMPAEITEELAGGAVRTTLCSYAIRAKVLRASGGFREYFETAEDIDMQLRLEEHGRIGYLPDVFYFYRIHASSITHVQNTARREFYERMAYQFHTQRKAAGADELMKGHPPIPPADLRHVGNAAAVQIQELLLGTAWREHGTGDRIKAMGIGWRAVRANMTNLAAWKSLAALILKPSGSGASGWHNGKL